MPPEPPAPETLAAIRGGDQGAFERLFRAWYQPLVNYGARIAPSPDAAEDAVQEVFIALWKNRASLPDASTLGAYLHRAVRNRALNQLRGTRGDVPLDADGVTEPSVAPDAELNIEGDELAAALRSAIAALPPRTREIFLLSREQELTYAQIADTLGVSVKTVETLMGRALRALREALTPDVTGDT